jgi:thiol-disulfide isomerase/thioredoxin
MTSQKKQIILALVAIVIIGAIVFINAKKPAHIDSSTAADVMNTPITKTIVTPAAPGIIPSATAPVVPQDRTAILAAKAAEYPKAKEFVGLTGYINTPALKLSDLVGKKVVLIDFWTYSCINCQRTIPYLNAWYQKYKDYGLVIVGVHTPEFDFEKDINNVTAAVQKDNIQYPVVLDSNMDTWNAYGNEYWPHEYLVDIDGYVVDDHIGEGGYAATEAAIQKALAERDQVLGIKQTIPTGTVDPSTAIALDDSAVQSPETYFGAERNEYLGNGVQSKIENQTLTIPTDSTTIQSNTLYLGGMWNFQYEYAETVSPVSYIQYNYNAKHVYMVASSKNPVTLKLTLDGQPYKTVVVQADQLYDLVDGTSYGPHTLQIEVDGAGLDAYTFTFG